MANSNVVTTGKLLRDHRLRENGSKRIHYQLAIFREFHMFWTKECLPSKQLTMFMSSFFMNGRIKIIILSINGFVFNTCMAFNLTGIPSCNSRHDMTLIVSLKLMSNKNFIVNFLPRLQCYSSLFWRVHTKRQPLTLTSLKTFWISSIFCIPGG